MITKMTANKKINILEFKHLMEYKEFKYLKKFMMYIKIAYFQIYQIHKKNSPQ